MADQDSGGGTDRPERQMFKGNWTCGECGGAITELPFEPDPARLSQLKCRECHKKGRPAGGGFSHGGRF